MIRYLAQQICIAGQCIQGPLPTGPGGINNLADLINRIIQFLIPLAVIILLLVFIWGGYDFILSQGNPEKVKAAQAKFTTGIIGFVLLLLSYIVVKLIALIFGLGGGIL